MHSQSVGNSPQDHGCWFVWVFGFSFFWIEFLAVVAVAFFWLVGWFFGLVCLFLSVGWFVCAG